MNKYEKEIPCAFCGNEYKLKEFPNTTYAKCAECYEDDEKSSFVRLKELLKINN